MNIALHIFKLCISYIFLGQPAFVQNISINKKCNWQSGKDHDFENSVLFNKIIFVPL